MVCDGGLENGGWPFGFDVCGGGGGRRSLLPVTIVILRRVPLTSAGARQVALQHLCSFLRLDLNVIIWGTLGTARVDHNVGNMHVCVYSNER